MKILLAAVVGTAMLVAPLAASAQSPLRGRGDRRDPGPPPAASAEAPARGDRDRGDRDRGGVERRGGDRNVGGAEQGRRREDGARAQGERSFQRGGEDRRFDRGGARNVERGDNRGDNRGSDRRDNRGDNRGFDRGDRRGFDRGDNRGFDGRNNDRRFDRGDDRRFDRGSARGRFDLRGYRPHHRSAYAGAYRSRSWVLGGFLPGTYWNSFLDPFAYDLPPAPWGTHWVLVRDEALLIEDGTGAIVDVVPLY